MTEAATIPIDTWLVFVGARVALAVAPGPNLAHVDALSIVQRRSAGFMSPAGTTSGLRRRWAACSQRRLAGVFAALAARLPVDLRR